MGQKLALIVGNSEYKDRNLSRLRSPSADVTALQNVLADPEIGGFTAVEALVDQSLAKVQHAIARFFAQKVRDDLLLLYFSGHGIRDDHGELFLAVQDTDYELPSGTAIPAGFLTREMDRSRAKRQILILDCCHSGAFAEGMKGALGTSVGTKTLFEGNGYGRVVLTASDKIELAWEGDQLIGEVPNSVFTHYLIEGIRTGQADTDRDGHITVDELYEYVHMRVVEEKHKQTPRKWTYDQEGGGIVLARNPRAVSMPPPLPPELLQSLENPVAEIRRGGVEALGRYLTGTHPGLALAARVALENVRQNDDSKSVVAAAADWLNRQAESERQKQERADEAARILAEREFAARRKVEERVERERAEAAKRQQPANEPLPVPTWANPIGDEPTAQTDQEDTRWPQIKWIGIATGVVLIALVLWISMGGSEEPGIHLAHDAWKGQKISSSMVYAVSPPSGGQALADRPMNFDAHVKGLCLAVDGQAKKLLTWQDLATCP